MLAALLQDNDKCNELEDEGGSKEETLRRVSCLVVIYHAWSSSTVGLS